MTCRPRVLEAVQNYNQPLSKEKLCAWQAAFFPTGYSEGVQIKIGQYRTNEEHIVSGMFGREKIHYVAPSPDRVEVEMQKFLTWFDGEEPVSSVIRSAIAHFWFVSIHPFEDGNGRLAKRPRYSIVHEEHTGHGVKVCYHSTLEGQNGERPQRSQWGLRAVQT